jgi:uncharacterized Zn finger protein
VTANEDDGYVSAEVRGDSARVYTVNYDGSGWECDCPTIGRCSHVRALMLVVVTAPREAAS